MVRRARNFSSSQAHIPRCRLPPIAKSSHGRRHVSRSARPSTRPAARWRFAPSISMPRSRSRVPPLWPARVMPGLVSSMGATAKSRFYYNHVNGEVEDALKRLDYEGLVIAQPSPLSTGAAAAPGGGACCVGGPLCRTIGARPFPRHFRRGCCARDAVASAAGERHRGTAVGADACCLTKYHAVAFCSKHALWWSRL